MKLNWKRILMVFIPFVIIVGVLCYFIFFNKNEEIKEDDEIKTEEPPVVETKELQIVDLESDSRPIAVMINNYSGVQPYQSGLNDAIIVYEMVVEAGITRMMAVYKDGDADRIGSIRSSRHYFLDYALEHDAIYTHIGYSDIAKNDIATYNVANIEGDYYWREDIDLAYEHRAFTSMNNIIEEIDDMNYRTTSDTDNLFNYSIDSVVYSDTSVANSVHIKYSNYQENDYTYNPETKLYEKTSNGEARLDYVTKEPVVAKNIITYQVYNYTIAGDISGRQELDTIGSGTGYLITEGQAIEIKWEKSSRFGQTVYTYLNGEEIVLNDGITHIQIQPVGQKLEIK